jgi:8-oxo-dGTP pyrophosphatase MutT (NUDIX family)
MRVVQTPRWRPTARIIVLDPDDRILLFSFAGGPDGSFWLTPGGGLHKGETPEAAGVRELAEETGYAVTETGLGPVVATCAGQWRGDDGTVFFGAHSFFCVRVTDPEVRTDGQEDLERSLITGYRWWTLEELAGYPGPVSPPDLPDLVSALLRNGTLTSPLRLAWRPLR